MAGPDVCSTPFGEVVVTRPLPDRTGSLRAWDGADVLLLERLGALLADRPDGEVPRLLVIGDRYGALSTAVRHLEPWIVSDSIVAAHSIETNLRRAAGVVSERLVSTFEELAGRSAGGEAPIGFDVVVWNVARSTDVVEHVAATVGAFTNPGSVLLAAGMDKYLPPRTGEILRRIGTVTTLPGRRKAHCFEVRPSSGERGLRSGTPPAPTTVTVPEHGLVMRSGPGVFSSDRLDLGARLLAARIAAPDPPLDPRYVVDLGCGNGILGLVALTAFPGAHVHFIDESAVAVSSARANVVANAGDAALGRCTFTRSDVFDDAPDVTADLILCNPPFHHGNAMDDEVAWRMLRQSGERLRPGGELWIVGNRHLGYHVKLARLFRTVRRLDAHPKFVVLAASNT